MPTQLIELAPELVTIDEERFPDRDSSFILEHLQRYCSLFDPLPAIGIHVEKDAILVTRGHKYLRVAWNLGRSRIRALVRASSDPDATAALLARPEVRGLNWAEIDAEERANPEVEQWHVYYFERPLDDDEKSRFDREVIGFLRGLYGPGSGRPEQDPVRTVEYDDAAACVQFRVLLPIGDESWYGGYRAAAQRFSGEVVGIVSFQGLRCA
jgi:hypothetical protein